MAYLTAGGIDDAVQYLAAQYSFCQAIVLPEPSVEGRPCRALKIAAGTGGSRTGQDLVTRMIRLHNVPADSAVRVI